MNVGANAHLTQRLRSAERQRAAFQWWLSNFLRKLRSAANRLVMSRIITSMLYLTSRSSQADLERVETGSGGWRESGNGENPIDSMHTLSNWKISECCCRPNKADVVLFICVGQTSSVTREDTCAMHKILTDWTRSVFHSKINSQIEIPFFQIETQSHFTFDASESNCHFALAPNNSMIYVYPLLLRRKYLCFFFFFVYLQMKIVLKK